MSESQLIYVVDDEPDFLEPIVDMLKGNKYEVVGFPSAQKMIGSLGQKLPDLILLDIIMAGMDGYELCRYIKKTPKLQSIKVCFLSAKDSPEDIEKGIDAGSDQYLKKPVQNRILLEEIKKLIGAPRKNT